jgi:hypothetical protein
LQNSCGRGGTRPSSGRNEAGFECFGGSRSTATVLPGVLQEPRLLDQLLQLKAFSILLSMQQVGDNSFAS